MTNDNNHKTTQIAFNIGSVNGNVGQQNFYNSKEDDDESPDLQDPLEKTKQLSISQAVIFFSALLGEPLESGYGKQKTKLADLISAVTGYKAGSVRQKIMEIGKMDVYPHNIQQDAEIVEKIISPYNSQVASDIRITYLDE
jgi:hypothetical protein